MDMKRRNRLWLISSAVSVLYICAAVLAFYQFQHLVRTLKYYGIPEEEQLRLENVVQMRNEIILAGSVFLLFGLLSAIISYGLLRSRVLAKYSWYALSMCFVIFHLYRLVAEIGGNRLVMIERGVELALTLAVAMGTWLLTSLSTERTVHLPPPPPEKFTIQERGDS